MYESGEFFYKYRYIDDSKIDHVKRIFTHNEMFFPSVDQFNDPFDCKFDFSFAGDEKEVRQYFWRNISRKHPDWSRKEKRNWMKKTKNINTKKFWSDLNDNMKYMKSEIGIYSLSRVPDSVLMWSHYSMSHTGFCLKIFDDPNSMFVARALPVSYSKEYPVIYPATDGEYERFEKTLMTKAKFWEYEEEWRIIDDSGPGIKLFPPKILVGVIFGCRMSEKHRDLVRRWCEGRQTPVSFYQAREAERTYALEIISE